MFQKYILSTLLIVSCAFNSSESSRKIKCFVNPGLNNSLEDLTTNVVYIASTGENDVIHYIWSTYKLPSVIVARTTLNTTLSINTTKLISFQKEAITFKSGKPLESVGLTFSELWELHYLKDASEITEISSVEDLDLESFHWTSVNGTVNCADTFASVVLKANSGEVAFSKNGTLQIQFSVSADQELSNEFPHLVFTGNSTLLKVILDDLYSNSSRVRYGFGLSVFSDLHDKCESDLWKVVTTKSINDEFSPGVFTDVELRAPCSDEMKSSFISWRPVAYTGQKPIVANSSDVTIMKAPQPTPEVTVSSIAELYFDGKSNVSVFNITFGTEGDGFYSKTEYTSWSLMLGTGSMIEIPLSTSVIVSAILGLALVLVFSVGGGIFILYRRCKEKDDDLLLN